MNKVILIIFLLIRVCSLSFAQQSIIELELFSSGFDRPLDLQHAGDKRIFIVEQGGKIKIIQQDGSINPIPFLDISAIISTGGERGLLGLAFHPEYQTNGYFYVNYTNLAGNTRVVRYSVDPNNPDVSLPNSDLLILGFEQPRSNHNGGHLDFGANNYLYIASGDGGGGGDPDGNGQNINSFLGKILRIDVDNPSNGKNYSIPSTNPFVGNPNAKEEIWAYGLRNPWRFTVDTNFGMVIADVGQGEIEEINWELNNPGGLNYGWRCYEGTEPYNIDGCPPSTDLTFPFAEYAHTNGNCSITGGLVREVGFPDIQVLYFFADFCSGLIASVDRENGWISEYGNFPGNWVSFGEDSSNNLYIIDITAGEVFQIDISLLTTEEFEQESKLNIFPIPASEIISIQMQNANIEQIHIYDTKGILVLNQSKISVSKTSVSVANFSKGLYFLEILSDTGKKFRRKLIIE